MAELIDDVRIEQEVLAGELTFKPEPFDLTEFCRKLCGEITAHYQHRNSISLRCQDVPQEVIMDPVLVRTILRNILSNAIRFSPPCQPVVLSVCGTPPEFLSSAIPEPSPGGCGIVFEVQDWGCGIAKEDLPKLFDPFNRCRSGGVILGTGLGLWFVHQCVELHGGRVGVQSVLNVGTVVHVLLPAYYTFASLGAP